MVSSNVCQYLKLIYPNTCVIININFYHFSKVIHEIETMLQEQGELVESSETLQEKIEFIKRERAEINNKINFLLSEKERERHLFISKYDILHK